jgi:hypothetical protein
MRSSKMRKQRSRSGRLAKLSAAMFGLPNNSCAQSFFIISYQAVLFATTTVEVEPMLKLVRRQVISRRTYYVYIVPTRNMEEGKANADILKKMCLFFDG